MADLRSPNVFIEEVSPAEAEQGVSAAQLGVVGQTERGPVNIPTKVNSLNEFQKKFGVSITESLTWLTVKQFFDNGGAIAVVIRVVPDGSEPATVDVDAPAKWTFRAKWPGTWANTFVVEIVGNTTFLDEITPKWDKYDVLVKEPDAFGLLIAVEVFEGVQFIDPTASDYITKAVNDPRNGSDFVVLEEALGGVPDAFTSSSVAGDLIATGDGAKTRFITNLTQGPLVITGSLVITDGVQVITDDGVGNLVGDVDPSGNNKVDYGTLAVDFSFTAAPAASAPITADFTLLPQSEDYALAGGTNGSGVITRDQVSHPDLQSREEGMYAFNKLQDIINLAIPDFVGNISVSRDQADLANSRRDRFAILEPPLGSTVGEAIVWNLNSLNRQTRRAAVYFPGVLQQNVVSGNSEEVPVIGVIAGIFARTEANKGVSKAPAGKIDGAIEGAIGPAIVLSIEDRNRLFENRINPIVEAAPTGFAVWGARTLYTVTQGLQANFRHIGPVRLFMFLEEFVYFDLHFAVFENNGRGLYQEITSKLEGSFSTFYNSNLFAGTTKKEAYRITCNGSNNTEVDIDNGIVNVDISAAPQLPAEFIVVRFQQKTAQRI